MTQPIRPSEDCPYCHGAGEVIVTRDPDVDMPCVCMWDALPANPEPRHYKPTIERTES